MKTVLPWVLVVALLAASLYLFNSNHQKDALIAGIKEENQAKLAPLLARDEEMQKRYAKFEEQVAQAQKDNEDLLRLRNEAGQLRQQNQQLTRQLQTAQAQTGQVQQQLTAQTEAFHTQTQQIQQAQVQAQTDECINNLRMIDGAKQQWALEHNKPANATPVASDLTPYFRNGVFPVCPAGGTYSINAVSQPPSCTVPNHALSPTR